MQPVLRTTAAALLAGAMLLIGLPVLAQQQGGAPKGTVPAFELKPSPLTLQRPAQPGTAFDQVGRRFAVLGDESGTFEAWAWPLKLVRGFRFSFLMKESTRPIRGADIVESITVRPEATTIRYVYQSFTVDAHFVTPPDAAGALVLLDVTSTKPMTVICGFHPSLDPMWPAGLGGQYSYWSGKYNAYVIGEPTRKNYALVGSPAAKGLSYTPAHMLSDEPSEFEIVIDDPKAVRGRYIPVGLAGGNRGFEPVAATWAALMGDPQGAYERARRHYTALLDTTMQVDTPDDSLDLAFAWAKVAYDRLLVTNPDLGTGLVAGLGASGTSGRPGFGWFFGGDAFINSFSLNSFGATGTTKQAIAFLLEHQRDDGKMPHEITQGWAYVDWFEDYPYGYFHGDTTPYFLVALHDYLRGTADRAFVRENWGRVVKAWEWCLSTDANGDGLMDNGKAGAGALEYGDLKGGIETDVYLGGIWVRAARAMSELARVAGDPRLAARADSVHRVASSAFDQKFWSPESEFYAYAFNAEGKRIQEFSPWNSVALTFGVGRGDRAVKSLARIGSSELMTDWGVRSISRNSQYFSPLNYNYGAVWPFLNSWVATAAFIHHLPQQGFVALRATAMHTFDGQLGAIHEVFSGTLHTWPQESVPHQGFSTAGSVLPLAHGLLGLERDALAKRVSVSPRLPANWDRVQVRNWRVGGAVLDVSSFRDEQGTMTLRLEGEGLEGWTARLRPAFGLGTGIGVVTVNGDTVEAEVGTFGQAVVPDLELALDGGSAEVVIHTVPTVEVLPLVHASRVGDPDRGMKLLRVREAPGGLAVELEGRAGTRGRLPLHRADRVLRAEGGVLEGGSVLVDFPAGEGFTKATVTLVTHTAKP